MMKKRADLTSTQLIGIILLVIGFVIALFFYFMLSGSASADREVCHESIIMRATIPSLIQAAVPLKCKAQKYCITTSLIGSDCPEYASERGVSKVKVSTPNDINKFIAQEIISCWSMVGEGKLGLFSSGIAQSIGKADVYPTCIICSRIAFDTKVKNSQLIAQINVLDYMKKYKMPGMQVSYFDYLAGDNGKISIQPGMLQEQITAINKQIEQIRQQEESTAIAKGLTQTQTTTASAVTSYTLNSDNDIYYNGQRTELSLAAETIYYLDSAANSVKVPIGKIVDGKISLDDSFKQKKIYYSTLEDYTFVNNQFKRIASDALTLVTYKEPEPNSEIAIIFMQISTTSFYNTVKATSSSEAGFFGKIGSFVVDVVDYVGGEGSALEVAKWTEDHPEIAAVVAFAIGNGIPSVGPLVGPAASASILGIAGNQKITAGYCSDVTSGKEARYGCSVIRTVKYDENSIGAYCKEIAGLS